MPILNIIGVCFRASCNFHIVEQNFLFRSKNVFPQALINFIIQSGGGFSKENATESKSYSMIELEKSVSIRESIKLHTSRLYSFAFFQFDLKLVNTHSGRLAGEKLDECNRLEINKHIDDPIECEKLIVALQELIAKTYPTE